MQRKQPAGYLVADDIDDEPSQRAAVEFVVASVLALPEPLLAVRVEEAAAEEVAEHGGGSVAIGVVGELGP